MRVLLYVGFTLGAGLLMALFIVWPGTLRYLFSVAAVLLGVRFFRSYESRAARIGFIIAAVLISLFIPLIYVPFAAHYGWPLNGQFKQG